MQEAVIYTRTSTQKQENGHLAQFDACKLWAETEGVEIKSVYQDFISGGSEIDQRIGFLSAIQDLSEGDILIAHKRDRIGRDVIINAVAENLIRSKGATLKTLDIESMEDSPESIFTRTLMDAVASLERAKIRARTKAVLMSKKSRGLVCGNISLGQKKFVDEDGVKRVVTNDEEQAKIDLVRSWRSEGLTFKEIQARCEEKGLTSRQGYTPTLGTLQRWSEGVKMTKKTKKSYEKRVDKGGRSGGFRSHKRKLDQDKALRALLITYASSGLTQKGIAEKLAESGLTTAKGNPYDAKQIRRWINELKEDGAL
jgi:DNA invertase Pin-like site-specific DNA recombinase